MFEALVFYMQQQERIPEKTKSLISLATVEKTANLIKEKNTSHKIELQLNQVGINDSAIPEPGNAIPTFLSKWKIAMKEISEYQNFNFLDFWNCDELLANLCQVCGSVMILFDTSQNLKQAVLVGLGCFLAWTNILRYLKYESSYSTLIKSIVESLPSVLKFCAGMSPLFIGFAFLGTAVFWQSPRYETVNRTMLTLFAIISCDGIFYSFHELSDLNFWFSQIYLYAFCLLFICVVQNLFLSIVYKVYAHIRRMERKTMKIKQDAILDSKSDFIQIKKSIVFLSNLKKR